MKTTISILAVTFLMCQISKAQVIPFFGNAAGVNYGYSVSGIGDFNGDGLDDFIATAQHGNGTNLGNAKIYFGKSPYPIIQQTADITINSTITNEFFGSSTAGNFDFNGDGFKDVMICARQNSGNRGRVYIFFGRCDVSPYTLSATTEADLIFNGEPTAGYFGWSASKAGDFDGDCIDDIIIGAPNAFGLAGRAYLIKGVKDYPSSVIPKAVNTISGVKILKGESLVNAQFGYSVANLGYMDPDKLDDIIIGAPGSGAAISGKVFIYHGKCSFDSVTYLEKYTGQNMSDDFGNSVAGPGDIDGDGFRDFIVGDWIYPDPSTGSVYVYNGNQIPLPNIFTPPLLFSIQGAPSINLTSKFGSSVSGIGDYNGDGFNDFQVGSSGFSDGFTSTTNAGREYRFFGGAFGYPYNLYSPVEIYNGNVDNGYAGISSSWAGDVNGDGINDALWSGYGMNDFTLIQTGAAVLDLSFSNFGYTTLFLRAYTQGTYSQSGNTEVKVCLYNLQCQLVDEKIVSLHTDGNAYDADGNMGIKFNNLPPNTPYYSPEMYHIVIKGLCNSLIETWSNLPMPIFRGGTFYYDFTLAASQAYGDNQKELVPGIYAIYSGDIDGDCGIDASDLSTVENDASIGAGGDCCQKTDLSDDGVVDASDLSTVDNNLGIYCVKVCECTCP